MNWSDVIGLVLTVMWTGIMAWVLYQMGYEAGERHGRKQTCPCRLAQQNGDAKQEEAS